MYVCASVSSSPSTRSELRAGSGQLSLAALADLAVAPDPAVQVRFASKDEYSVQKHHLGWGPGTVLAGAVSDCPEPWRLGDQPDSKFESGCTVNLQLGTRLTNHSARG